MPTDRLLTRDQFRAAVFARDGGKCVFCGATEGLDAHHILDRRLWPDGGYYLSNGATVCGPHELQCETTEIPVDEVRSRCGITRPRLPPQLEAGAYDKWGNPVLPNGTRLRGELYHDAGVQQILANHLHLFTDRVKYPRTYHLPWSPGAHGDDRMIDDLDGLIGQEVVVTEKLDGENTTIYADGALHARSLEYGPRVDRNRVRALAARIAADEIPAGWRICGENLWARHSITYTLPHDFLVFSVWDDRNVALSWDDTVEWAALLDLPLVPVLYRGPWDEGLVRRLCGELDPVAQEGLVVRTAAAIPYALFRRRAAKWVRANHVQTEAHWTRHIEPNPIQRLP